MLVMLSRTFLDTEGNIEGLEANVTAVINGFEGMQAVMLSEQGSY